MIDIACPFALPSVFKIAHTFTKSEVTCGDNELGGRIYINKS